MSSEFSIEVNDLTKSYDGQTVVDHICFNVKKGQVFGFLGPNGAGKTTTLEMIEGLRKPDAGEVRINGMELHSNLKKIRSLIGVQLQSSAIDDRIRVGEVIELFGSYYNRSVDVDALLELVKLTEKKRSFQKDLSGGQRQRMSFALSIVNDPEIIFLDEPTTGLDPQSRRNLWELIETMRTKGKTIVLTTHYMDEAEKLCDDIAVIDHGKIITQGTPNTLINQLDADRVVDIRTKQDTDVKTLLNTATLVEQHGDITEIYSEQIKATLDEIFKHPDVFDIDTLHIRKATLEDVFIHLTGRSLRD